MNVHSVNCLVFYYKKNIIYGPCTKNLLNQFQRQENPLNDELHSALHCRLGV